MIILKPGRPKKKSRNWRRLKRKLPMAGGLAVLISLFYFVFFSSLFKVNNIIIEGNRNIPADKLKAEIESEFKNKYLLVFPFNNLLVLPKDKLDTHLKEKFKRIDTIQIQKQLVNVLHINIIEKRGAFKWCRLDGCFLVNEQGLAYNILLDETTLTEEEKALLTIKESTSGLPAVNEKIIDSDFIKIIWEINDMLESDIAEFTTPSILAGRVVLVMKDGWQLILSFDWPIKEQLTNLKALFSDEITLEQRKNLEYIDLTVQGRAYYKMKN